MPPTAEELGIRRKELRWYVFFGLIGAFISILSIRQAYVTSELKEEIDNITIELNRESADVEAAQLFHTFLPIIRSDDQVAKRSVGIIAERLQARYESRLFADLVLAMEQTGEAEIEPALKLQLEEATEVSHSDQWIAVAHSFRGSNLDLAKVAACETLKKIQANWPESIKPEVEIYQTKISSHFAVAVGGFTSEARAKAIVRLLKQTGIKNDAFAQRNREWELKVKSGETLITVTCR